MEKNNDVEKNDVVEEKDDIKDQLMVEILIGTPGSNKTEYALNKVSEEKNWRRLSKEDLARTIFGKEDVLDIEEIEVEIDMLEMSLLVFFLETGNNVILDDDDNLDPRRLKLICDTIDQSDLSPIVFENPSFDFVPFHIRCGAYEERVKKIWEACRREGEDPENICQL